MYKNFPHRCEKVRIFHYVHQVDTIEEVERSVPRIYTTLDNNKYEF
jgi:hypothetical protein